MNTATSKPTYEELEAENKRLRETTVPLIDASYAQLISNVGRNALTRIERVDYGEDAVRIAKDALAAMKKLGLEWNEETKPK